ncbi:FecCD family ABC transporter permease [Thermosipho ferrireducens]|uniref:FecCD family ABC transporter permease n=1 Tax=Thermosipho ferrireducens TaxID=2571116 RepID=UPI001D195C00|nr:iron ABC transporter permease [Thermosipho ferrireducens]
MFVLTILINISLGSVRIEFKDIFTSIFEDSNIHFLIWRLRFPRVLMSIITGSALAIVGSVFQSIMKNPLVDPYLIGTSAGAGFGAVMALYLISSLNVSVSVPIFSFVFALLASLLTIALARKKDVIPITHLILSGVLISTVFSSGTILLINFSHRSLTNVYVWLFGSLSGITYEDLLFPFLVTILFLLFAYIKNGELDAMALGEDEAKILGVEVEKLKWILYIFGSFTISVIVSKTGIIGFVGLIIPHASRLVVGSRHKYNLIGSAIIGGIFLSFADTISRTVVAPIEIPVGVITSFVGAPLMFILLKRGGKG